MPLRPSDQYDPVQTVLPSTQQPNDYIRTEASPLDFGAQVGQAAEKLGGAAEGVGQEAAQAALQRQGMINESLATNAETDYITQLSSTMDKYRANEGLAAEAALPKTQADIAALRQQTLQSLPNLAAQRAFNMLASRHEAYALSDAATWASTQVRAADLQSATSSLKVAEDQAGSLPVAQNDARFQDQIHDINFGVNRVMQNKGYGGVMQQAPDGTVTFADGPDGDSAKAVYSEYRDQHIGSAWENRIKALTNDPSQGNVQAADDLFNKNRASIPPAAQMSIAAFLTPKVRAYQSYGIAGATLSALDAGYAQTAGRVAAVAVPGQAPATNFVQTMTAALAGQESGNNAAAPTSVDGAVGKMQIVPATFQQYARPGENINNPADNAAVGGRIVADLAAKYPNDPARVAVGYFSGPQNVAPPGSSTPWIHDAVDGNGKATSSYVSDALSRMGGVGAASNGYVSKADYYRAHGDEAVENARNYALQQNPDDPQAAEVAAARVRTQINATISQDGLIQKADSDTVWRAINGDFTKGTPPLTVDQLRAASPEAAASWDRLAATQPQVAHEIETKVLPQAAAANGGDDKKYGPGYWDVFRAIHAPDGTPGKIRTQNQLYALAGTPGGLSQEGLDQARKELNFDDSEKQMRDQFFTTVKQHLSWEDPTLPGMGKDPKGAELLLKAIPLLNTEVEHEKENPKMSLGQIYSLDNPAIKGIIDGLKRSDPQHMADMMAMDTATEPAAQPATTQQPAPDLGSKAGIIATYRAIKNPTQRDFDTMAARLRGLPEFAVPPSGNTPQTGGYPRTNLPPAPQE